jgi:hypothetical protein
LLCVWGTLVQVSGLSLSAQAALRDDLERLMTLQRDQIDWACSNTDTLTELVAFGLDEVVELRELAEHEWDRGNEEIAQHLEQEASAWNHTVRLLRAALAQCGSDEQHKSDESTGRHRKVS